MRKDFSAVILAAGLSERMGKPKISLLLNDGTSFLEHIVSGFKLFGCKQIVVVVNTRDYPLIPTVIKADKYGLDVAINENPELGRMHSLKKGLGKLKQPTNVFIHNIDNPFVDVDILKLLAEQLDKAEYIYPTYKGKGGHPALISEAVMNNLLQEKHISQNLKDYLAGRNTIKISTDNERILININSMNDYSKHC